MIILMCIFVTLIHASSPKCERTPTSPTWEDKLKSDITRKYLLHPGRRYNATVALHFNLRHYTFDEKTQEFYIYSYMMLKWFDDSMKWNPKDYDGIDRTDVRTTRFWTPKIIQKDNDNNIFKSLHFYVSTCMVSSDGRVVCIPEMSHSGNCQSSISNWPYDVHTCEIKFVAKENVTITRNGTSGVTTNSARESVGWNIILSAYTESEEKLDEITLTFVLERSGDGLAAVHVIPLIVVAILNITALVIDVQNNLRVYLLCFCLLGHVNFVNENFPKFGSVAPKILIFLRTSLIVCILFIVFTFIFKRLRRKVNLPSVYILRCNSFSLEGSRKVFMWEKNVDVRDHNDAIEEWALFVKVLNSFLIIVSCFVYFVLFVVYIPRRTYL